MVCSRLQWLLGRLQWLTIVCQRRLATVLPGNYFRLGSHSAFCWDQRMNEPEKPKKDWGWLLVGLGL